MVPRLPKSEENRGYILELAINIQAKSWGSRLKGNRTLFESRGTRYKGMWLVTLGTKVRNKVGEENGYKSFVFRQRRKPTRGSRSTGPGFISIHWCSEGELGAGAGDNGGLYRASRSQRVAVGDGVESASGSRVRGTTEIVPLGDSETT